MKKLLILVTFLSTMALVYCQSDNEGKMPVTVNSKKALALYNQAMKYYNDVNLPKALETFNKALGEDPDFLRFSREVYLLHASTHLCHPLRHDNS